MELLNSIEWYITKMNNAQAALLVTPPPADIEYLRFNHGIYIESIFSLIDYMHDNKHSINEDIKKVIGGTFFYFRTLRNSIVHRGFDLSTRGTVINGNVRVLTPDNVVHKGELLPVPAESLLLKATMLLDVVMRLMIILKLNDLGVLDEKDIDEDAEFKCLCSSIEKNDFIPIFAKEIFMNNKEEIKKNLNFSRINNDRLTNLRNKLSPVDTLTSLSTI